YCRAIYFYEGPFVPQTRRVQLPRNQLFPGSTLPVNQHAPIGRRGYSDLLPQSFNRHALADYLIAVPQFASQQLIFILQAALLDCIANQDNDFFEGERFLDEIKGSQL